MNKRKKRGLSLVETLVTMAILGIIVLGSSKVIMSFTRISVKERKTTERNRKIEEIFKMIKKDTQMSEEVIIGDQGRRIIFTQRKEIEPKAPDYKITSKLEYISYKVGKKRIRNEFANRIIICKSSDKKMTSDLVQIDQIEGYNITFKKVGEVLIIKLSYLDEKGIIITEKHTIILN